MSPSFINKSGIWKGYTGNLSVSRAGDQVQAPNIFNIVDGDCVYVHQGIKGPNFNTIEAHEYYTEINFPLLEVCFLSGPYGDKHTYILW
jgi:hypothetical protein